MAATGTVSAVKTVQVGTQISGTIYRLHVDFNSPVTRGQIIAEIDPALLQAQLEQAEGNELSARANLEKAAHRHSGCRPQSAALPQSAGAGVCLPQRIR